MGWKSTAALGSACLLAAAPAIADVRAEYVDDDGRAVTTVEIDDRGQIRIGNEVQGYYLSTSQGEFDVRPGPGGPMAIALEASAWLARGKPQNRTLTDSSQWRYEAGETVEAGGREGRVYRMAGPNVPSYLVPIIVSTDPALAPIGLAMMQQNSAFHRRNDWPVTVDQYTALMRHGAVLANATMRLGAVSFEPIAPERFRLPVAPITLADVQTVQLDEPQQARRRPSVVQVAFFDGQLWTLDDEGGLARTPEGGDERIAADPPERPLALCRAEQGLWLVTQAEEASPVGLWLRGSGGTWALQGRVPVSPASRFLGTECSGPRPLSLFNDRLIEGAGHRVLSLDADKLRFRQGFSSVLRADGALYLAMNNGEWGGGIHRIQLPRAGSAARTAEIEALCDRAQRAACSAVTGLAADPDRSGCLLASLGTVHFFASGEVVRVCGTSIERVYRKPYTMKADWSDADSERGSTVPFFALAGGRGEAWAVGADGVYRFDGGAPALHRFPPVRSSAIDWSLPGVVLVPTDMNQRHSLSGGSLLLAVR